MKRIYFLGSLAFLSLLMIVTGCSDEFLNDKTVYGKFGEDQVYGNFTSAQERVNYLYYSMMPISGSGSGNGSSGMNDYTSTGFSFGNVNLMKQKGPIQNRYTLSFVKV